VVPASLPVYHAGVFFEERDGFVRTLGLAGFALVGLAFPGVGGCKEETPIRPVLPTQIVLIVRDRQDPLDAALVASAQDAVNQYLNTVLRVIEVHSASGAPPQSVEPSHIMAGILLACEPTEPLKQQIALAAKLGVRIFAIGNLFRPSETEGVDWQPEVTVACEVELAGSDAVKGLIQNLETRNLLPRNANAVILQRNAKGYRTSLRAHAMEGALLVTPASIKTLPPVEITQPPPADQATIEDLLRRQPDLAIILCTDADLLLAAVRAAEKVRPQALPAIGGFDATPQTQDALKAGRIQFLIDLRPDKLARRATIFALSQRQTGVKHNATIWVPAEILTPEHPQHTPSTQTAPADRPTERS
jgi:ABC-type sugar transport system substrate-binding protein